MFFLNVWNDQFSGFQKNVQCLVFLLHHDSEMCMFFVWRSSVFCFDFSVVKFLNCWCFYAFLISGIILCVTGSEVGADDRSWLINHVNSLSVEHSTSFLYPRLFVLNEPREPDHEGVGTGQHSFRQIRASSQYMRSDQAYLMENGVAMFLWLGSQVDPVWIGDVFGVAGVAQVDIEKVCWINRLRLPIPFYNLDCWKFLQCIAGLIDWFHILIFFHWSVDRLID